jgi:hypothetical protein
MKNTILTIALALLVAAPLSTIGATATQAGAPLSANTAVRGESASTVYWYANDGKRYVFLNTTTFYSWFPSFSDVRTVLDSDLVTIPLGGNVTYRPGAKLVKIDTDPKVYAVAKNGVLRHVTSEYLAEQLYGADWRYNVHDIPDVYFTNYTVGTPIYNVYDYNVSNEYNGVSTPSDSLRNPTNWTSILGYFNATANRTTLNAGENLTLTATLRGGYTLPSNYRIEIQDPRTAQSIKTCWNVTTCSTSINMVITGGITNIIFHARLIDGNGTVIADEWFPTVSITDGSTSNSLTIWTDKTSINSGDSVMVSAWSSDTFNASRIEVRDERDNSLVFTCYDVRNCSQSRTFFRRNTSENTFRLYAQLKDWNGAVLRTAYTPTMTFNGTSQTGTLTLTADRTSITSGQAVQLNAYYGGTFPTNGRVEIQSYTYGAAYPGSQTVLHNFTTVKTCYTNSCHVTVHPTTSSDYRAVVFNSNGTIVDGWVGQCSGGSSCENIGNYVKHISVSGSGSSNGDNRINGLVLNADRTNINAGELVRLTANAFNSGTWSYTGNRIDIVDAHRGTIVRTCYDVSTCVVDVYPQAQSSTNLTAQYQARIYDRNGVLAMTQYGPVIYLSSANGTTNGSNGNTTLGTGTITFAPTDALHPNRNVYLTATFVDSNIPLYDAQVRIYTEDSSTPIATCNSAYTCSVSYSTGPSPMTTRTYAQLSNHYNAESYVETPRVTLTTTW